MKVSNIYPYFPPETNGISISTYNRVISLSKLNYDTQIVIPNYNNQDQQNHIKRLEEYGINVALYSTMGIKGPRLGQMPYFRKSK